MAMTKGKKGEFGVSIPTVSRRRSSAKSPPRQQRTVRESGRPERRAQELFLASSQRRVSRTRHALIENIGNTTVRSKRLRRRWRSGEPPALSGGLSRSAKIAIHDPEPGRPRVGRGNTGERIKGARVCCHDLSLRFRLEARPSPVRIAFSANYFTQINRHHLSLFGSFYLRHREWVVKDLRILP